MPTVDFLPYATGMGANVESQLAYSTDPTTAGGQLAGIAKSSIFNKIWRQGNFFAAVLANFIANQLGVSVLDDGDVSGKITLFQNAIIQLCSTVFAPITSPNFLGVPTAPTVAGTSDNSTKIATTGFVQAVRALLAPLASPAFTGTPTAPTPSAGDNSTKLATTAFVQSEGVPVGASIIWNASSPPANYLEENGASLSTSTYATLLAAREPVSISQTPEVSSFAVGMMAEALIRHAPWAQPKRQRLDHIATIQASVRLITLRAFMALPPRMFRVPRPLVIKSNPARQPRRK